MKTKRELKNIYKEKKFKIGVFQIRNTQNNKIFIDSSTDLDAIWNRHKFQLNFGAHANIELQMDWNEYGEDTFTFEIISVIDQKDDDNGVDYRKEVKELKDMFIEELQPFSENGYNVRKIRV